MVRVSFRLQSTTIKSGCMQADSALVFIIMQKGLEPPYRKLPFLIENPMDRNIPTYFIARIG